MDLKEFVTETLVALHEGVADAIRELDQREAPGTVNPHWMGDEASWEKNVDRVEFDVAVTASDKTGGTGKAGIKVFGIVDAGGEGSKSVERSTVSRVKFSIPVIFPAAKRHAKDPGRP